MGRGRGSEGVGVGTGVQQIEVRTEAKLIKRLKKKVVFVLGAGSSCEYGRLTTYNKPRLGMLPTAAELKTLIIDQPSIADIDTDWIVSSGGQESSPVPPSEPTAEQIAGQFAASGLVSIDRFLERRTTFVESGKRMIANVLLPLEREAIQHRSIATGWYQWLFNEITNRNGLETTVESLEFITFNYDRTLEVALRTMMINAFGMRPEEAEKEVNRVSIRHVYGELKSELSFDPETHLYRVRHWGSAVLDSAKEISIVQEERDKPITELSEVINSATAVIFLGFGYDETNLRRLGIGPNPGGSQGSIRVVPVFASAYGLGDRQRSTYQSRLANSSQAGWHVQMGAKEMRTLEFLKEHVDLRTLLDPTG